MTIELGNISISRLIEMEGPFVEPDMLFPDATEEGMTKHKNWLAPQFVAEDGRLICVIPIRQFMNQGLFHPAGNPCSYSRPDLLSKGPHLTEDRVLLATDWRHIQDTSPGFSIRLDPLGLKTVWTGQGGQFQLGHIAPGLRPPQNRRFLVMCARWSTCFHKGEVQAKGRAPG